MWRPTVGNQEVDKPQGRPLIYRESTQHCFSFLFQAPPSSVERPPRSWGSAQGANFQSDCGLVGSGVVFSPHASSTHSFPNTGVLFR